MQASKGEAADSVREAVAVPAIGVYEVSKTFSSRHGSVQALDNVSFEVPSCQFHVLLGPSGCGKTTLLRTVAGLEAPSAGSVRIAGTEVFSSSSKIDVPPERRGIGMVFQSYALWPHMTVEANVAYPLRAQGLRNRTEVKERCAAALEMVGCGHLATRRPYQLSGGQQQRIALARALVANARLILLDEPLSSVDAQVRQHLRDELLALHETLCFSALYVTHDQDEAMALADVVGVMNSGSFVQIAKPEEIYSRPANGWVASFVGNANIVLGIVASCQDTHTQIDTEFGAIVGPAGEGWSPGQKVELCIRPESIRLADAHVEYAGTTASRETVLNGTYLRSTYRGAHKEAQFKVGSSPVRVHVDRLSELEAGRVYSLHVLASDVHMMPSPAREEPTVNELRGS